MLRRYFLVLLAGIALARDSKKEEIPGIDFILGAYGGMFAEDKVGETSIVYCGNRGQRVSESRVYTESRSKKKGMEFREVTRMHFLTADYPDSAEMIAFLDEAKSAAAAAGSTR